MKTKTFFILCLIIGMANTRLFSQNNTLQWKVMDAEYHTAVFCDGVQVDFLTGVARVHVVYHQKDGNFQMSIDQYHGEATGLYGEVFQITEIDKWCFPAFPYLTWHFNLTGNKGNHYIGTLTYNWDTDELIPGKTVCH